jgi:hypothetical protein
MLHFNLSMLFHSHVSQLYLSYMSSYFKGLKYLTPTRGGFQHPLIMYTIGLLALSTLASGAFVHPGLLHTQADFDRMKQKVAANASPWNASYSILISNSHTNLGYTARPQTYVNRGSDCIPNNGMILTRDASAAYQMALVWKIIGDNRYANKSIEIMNAWSSTITEIGCQGGRTHDYVLMAAMQGLAFANAAEIMRSYSG